MTEKKKPETLAEAYTTGATDTLDLSIKQINELSAKKDAEINYWKRKCWILANNANLCKQHAPHKEQESFNDFGVDFETYIEKRVECSDCEADKLERK